ncbi:MAG: hypothetical protein GKS02_11455 [Alphaproteobacteria bacterium]|nr:hypothetical protein [Alphaproteobacteria bacterium]
MHGLIWFLPDFRDWPLTVAQGLQSHAPDWTFCGLVSGFEHDYDHVESSTAPAIRPLYNMDHLQRAWLTQPAETAKLEKYGEILGPQTLNRILIADRNIGRGFVAGVDLPETPLMRLTREHEHRMRYLIGLLDFLFDVFEHEKPDYVFAAGVAGALAMALAAVSEHFDVKFRNLLSTRIGTGHTITEASDGLCPSIEERFKQASLNPQIVEPWLDDARAIVTAFHDRPHGLQDTETAWQRAARPLRPIDMAALAWRAMTRRPPELINLPYPASYFAWEIRRRFRVRRMLRSGLFHTAAVLDGRKFAYFPLHITPEASTMVLAPLMTDQISVIETLAKCLPSEMRLAVKEHVPMIGRRPIEFYRRLAAIPKVVLISPTAETFDLIRRADLTCVITGTAAWEAILMKRPALCLGRALYQTVGEGFVRCEELSRLPEAISEALAVAPASDDKIAIYIASVLAESFELPKRLRFSVPADIVAAHPEISQAMVDRLLKSFEPAVDPLSQPASESSIG